MFSGGLVCAPIRQDLSGSTGVMKMGFSSGHDLADEDL